MTTSGTFIISVVPHGSVHNVFAVTDGEAAGPLRDVIYANANGCFGILDPGMGFVSVMCCPCWMDKKRDRFIRWLNRYHYTTQEMPDGTIRVSYSLFWRGMYAMRLVADMKLSLSAIFSPL